jgi:putative redox protein
MPKILARRRQGYTHDVEIEGGHTLVIDEPVADGGGNEGPSPTRTLAAALASCTAITAEMYGDRKGWDLGALEVEVEITYDGSSPSAFEVTLRCPGELDDDQLERLLTIARKCPVHRLLSHETTVTVTDHIVRC